MRLGGRTGGALYSGWIATTTFLRAASSLCGASTLAAMTAAMTGPPVIFLSISALSAAPVHVVVIGGYGDFYPGIHPFLGSRPGSGDYQVQQEELITLICGDGPAGP